MLSEKEKDDLRQLLALAETVRPKLLSTLTLGPKSLEHEAYAIKARVKGFESAIDKIVEKRAKKPDYGPWSLTDVLGVRILCLWPDDISKVLEKLISTVREVTGTSLSSFQSSDVAEVITEVIVYKGPNSPAIYDVIGDQLLQWLEFDPRLSGCVSVEPSPRDRPYSSVHIILWCRAPVGADWVPIPVEVQVRTSLEDVWSEAEHRLRYKGQQVGSEQTKIVGNRLLEDLKAHLDVAASTITSARDLLLANPPARGGAVSRIAAPTDPVLEFGLGEAAPDIRDRVTALVERITDFYRQFETERGGAHGPPQEDWGAGFEALDAEIGALISDVGEEGGERWRFWSSMEAAQVKFWRAKLAREDLIDNHDESAILKADALVEGCLRAYLDIMADDAHHGSSMLWFRFGNALLELKGDFAQALMYIRRADEEIADDPDVPEDNVYRLIIPRMHAYCIWRLQNDQLRDAVAQYGMRSPVAAYSLEQLRMALTIMVPLARKAKTIHVEHTQEQAKVLGNLISYAWYYSLLAEQSSGSSLVTREALREHLKSVVSTALLAEAYKTLASDESDAQTMNISRLHSLAAGAFLTGNRKGLETILSRLRQGLEERVARADGEVNGDLRQMLTDVDLMEGKENQ